MTDYWRNNISIIREALVPHDGTDPLRAREALCRLESDLLEREQALCAVPPQAPDESDRDYDLRLVTNALLEYMKPNLGLTSLGRAAFEAWKRALERPIAMRLTCEACGRLHIDEGEFATKPHHTHTCQYRDCGITWRPAREHTVGVRFIPGFMNATPPADDGPPRKGSALGLASAHDATNEGLGSQLHEEPLPALKTAGEEHPWRPNDYAEFADARGERVVIQIKEVRVTEGLMWILAKGRRHLIDPEILSPWKPREGDRVGVKNYAGQSKVNLILPPLYLLDNPVNNRRWFERDELVPVVEIPVLNGSRWRLFVSSWEVTVRLTADGLIAFDSVDGGDRGGSHAYTEEEFRRIFRWVKDP